MDLAKSQDIKLTHRNLLYSYTLTMKNQKEIKEAIPFTIATRRIKYLRIDLPKGTEDMYAENYKTLMKETKDNAHTWRNMLGFWIGRINIMKMTILPNAIYRFNEISIKLPMAFCTAVKQKIL